MSYVLQKSMIFPGTDVRLTSLYFPESSLILYLKMGVMFPFLQPPETSPDSQDFSDMMESVLAVTSANSFRILGYL